MDFKMTDTLKEAQTAYLELRNAGMSRQQAIIFSHLFSTIQAEFRTARLETDRLIGRITDMVEWKVQETTR